MNYEEVVSYLYDLPRFKTLPGVVREREILERLKNPQTGLKIIHIAGTNGKGSVCAYLERMLREAGYRTGTFTSPHLVKVNERIKINGADISDVEFLNAFKRVFEVSKEMAEEGMESAAFFDYLTAMALLIFAEKKVDFAIMETGLGGRLDCTNAIENPALCVITSISLDHTEILGDTVQEIAAEKAGIIKTGVPAVYLADKEVKDIFAKQIEKTGAFGTEVNRDDAVIVKRDGKGIDFLLRNQYYKNDMFSLLTIAEYQVINSSIALVAASVLEQKGLAALPGKIKKDAVLHTVWEGRMEQVFPNFYVDGAHNEDGIRVFLQTAGEVKAKRKLLLFSAVREKNYESMIREICESGIFDGYILTQLGRDNHRALALSAIREEFERWQRSLVYTSDSVFEALELMKTITNKEDIVFAAGSLYLVGEIKAAISGGNND